MNATEKSESGWCAAAVLDAIAIATVQLDAQSRVLGLNAAAQEMLSVGTRTSLGRPLAELVRLPAVFDRHLQASLDEGSWRLMRGLQLHTRHGDALTVDMDMQPFGESGVLLQISSQDRPMRAAREDALMAQSASGQMLLRGLAHEVKNPLGGLRGAAQLLESELADPALREYTRIIITEADRLHRLIDRMSGPQSAPAMRALNVHRVTEHVRQLLEADRPSGVEIGVSYDPSLPRLYGDFEWLVQALLNLGLNAVQAVGEQGQVTIVTRARSNFSIGQTRHRLVIELQVRDDGPGVAEDMLARMFLPMVTGRSEGTGLGLPIAQNLIGHHGGLIECVSQPGETVFSVYLPLESEHE